MTGVTPDPDEPPPPQRGLTREERGRDVSEAQAEAETSTVNKLLKSMSLPFVLSQADGYPVVIKQFLQFCLLLIYPAWIFAALVMFAIYYVILLPGYYVLLAVFWVLFWPLRVRQKKKNPEEYEEYRKKYWRR